MFTVELFVLARKMKNKNSSNSWMNNEIEVYLNNRIVVAVVQSLSNPTLCDPMNCSMPGFSVHHYLPEFAQTHVHWVSDAIQPSHPLTPFSSCPQSFPASESFPMSRLFASGGQSIRASASASVLPMNNQDWFPLGLTGLISFLSKGLSRVFSSTTSWKHQFFAAQPFLWSTSHNHAWLLVKPSVQLSCSVLSDSLQSHGPDILHIRCQNIGKTITLTVWTFVGNVMSLLFNTLSRFVITFLPRSKHLLISCS